MKKGIVKKIMGSLLFITCIYLLTTGIAYFLIRDVFTTLNEIKAVSKRLELTGDLQLYINKLVMPANDYLITGDTGERDNFDKLITQVSEVLEELKRHKGGKDWEAVSDKVSTDAVKLGEMAIELLYIDNPVGNKIAGDLMEKMDAFSEQVIEEAGKFHHIAEEDQKKIEQKARAMEKTAYITFGVILFMFIASVPFLSFYLSKHVTGPIIALHEGAGVIGTGKLSHRISINTGDELETLADGFNKMAGSLEDAKKDLDRKIFELYTLYNVSKVMNTTFETEQLLVRLVGDISNNMHVHRVVIMLLDDKTQELSAASFTDFKKEGLQNFRRRIGEGLYGLVAETRTSRLVRDVDTEPGLDKKDILSPDIQSIIAVPFGRREKVLGLLCAFKDRPQSFEWYDLELFRTVAEQVAVALENAKLFEETKLLAITDGLTGLYNHRFFIDGVKIEIERAERYNHNFSLLILDVDQFKHYNDTHGHPKGDEILSGIATLIRKTVRSTDLACRYGGEEFSVILPETGKSAATALAERLREAISEYPFPFRETQPMGAITVSIGVASYPADDKNTDELIRKADDALYRAKEGGRNRVVTA